MSIIIMKQLHIPSKSIQESGYLLPWNLETEQPAFITIDDIDFIPVFSTLEKLEAHNEFTKYKFSTSIKQIDNINEFLASVVLYYRVALDPRLTEYGTTRFTELVQNHVNN